METYKKRNGGWVYYACKSKLFESLYFNKFYINLFLQDITDLKSAIEIQKTKLKSYDLTFQPTPVVVGENLRDITSCYIAFDDIFYKIPTIAKTIDICFKLTHVLKANYPYEAGQLWLIVQRGIYGLKTEWDSNFVGVETILRSF